MSSLDANYHAGDCECTASIIWRMLTVIINWEYALGLLGTRIAIPRSEQRRRRAKRQG